MELKNKFCGKSVSVIVDETTDVKARSVVNVLFSYRSSTKLISVEFLEQDFD
ncbi:19063_t:CDS:2 [Cetraspora pellucida]|uniref:19063_t:CDS:1 n=1 Tax=Cetraspora pellucida TaxID=1433469 RepID=A0A9N9IAE5_9GLOM|nr:19063_t:CDS:2 [Cetraspora pellucida]